MSSMTKIETAIQRLSVAEQRIIAQHIDERLVEAEHPGPGAADEGIRFLPQYDSCPPPRQSRGQKFGQKTKTNR